MQKVLDHREAMAPHRAAEAEDATQYWEARKARLGITVHVSREIALQRIGHARAVSLSHPPRQRGAYAVEQEQLGIEQSISALEIYHGKLAAEASLEGAYTSLGKRRHPQGVARVEALLAEGKAHGIDTAAPRVTRGWERSEHRTPERSPERTPPPRAPVAARLRTAALALGIEDEPAGGAGLRIRIAGKEEEHERGESMGW
jgi:hypothetical protein